VKAREDDGSPFVYIGLLAVKKGHQVRMIIKSSWWKMRLMMILPTGENS